MLVFAFRSAAKSQCKPAAANKDLSRELRRSASEEPQSMAIHTATHDRVSSGAMDQRQQGDIPVEEPSPSTLANPLALTALSPPPSLCSALFSVRAFFSHILCVLKNLHEEMKV